MSQVSDLTKRSSDANFPTEGEFVMPETPKGVLELLEQLRQERDELNVLIQGLERRLGVVSNETPVEATQARAPRVTVSVDSIPVGFFHNLSQADATEKLLRLHPGQPLKTSEILNALRKSGMQINQKNGITILYTTLKRSPKFERVAGKAWGLSEWYPQGKKRKKDSEEETEEGV
jgi:hypothetical protein